MSQSRGRLSLAGSIGACALASASVSGQPLFIEVPAETSGLTWSHANGRSPARNLPETLGPGCAFLDYDSDGWVDVYLVNSGPADFSASGADSRNALYRNAGDGTFTDVTDDAGVEGGDSFGMGVAAGDYDNDGDPDLFTTAYGSTRLYRNDGDGSFSDVTAPARLQLEGWTTCATWFDYDGDGWLDLFVCSFVRYGPDERVPCHGGDGRPHYCIPRMFQPTPSVLFRNQGDGTFRREGDDALRTPGKALGAVAADVNGDRRPDLFVANDTEPNFLLLNRPGGRWEEVALWSGVAVDIQGHARSGMGVDAADVDGDGRQDLFVANVDHEMSSLYLNNADGTFVDVAVGAELGRATFLLSGWGVRFLDFDNDGDLDLLTAHGHPDDRIEDTSPSVAYEQPLLLFRQEGEGFENASAEAGPVFSRPLAARCLAVGDVDNDGLVDALVGVNGGTPLLLRNVAAPERNWVGLRLEGRRSNRDAVGARVTWAVDGVVRTRWRAGGGSYLASHDPRLVLGLGSAESADWVEIAWPDGRVDRLDDVRPNRYTAVVERGRQR